MDCYRANGRAQGARLLFSGVIAWLLLATSCFSDQITDFNATFTYQCDNGYFDKGDSLFTFRMAGTVPLRMRKLVPTGWSKSQRLPAIVMFFGGGWTGDCAPEFKWFKNYFINQGFVVFIAEYILGSPVEQKAIPDGKAAIRWIRKNADTLGVDPQKIISLGSSAGGHLAAAVGTVKGYELSGENLGISSRPNVIISMWPVMDLTKSFSNVTSVDPKLVSPAWALDDTVPPILVMTGGNDPYMSGVQQFNTNAVAYKFEHQYKEYPNAGHDFGFRPVGGTATGNAGEDSSIAWSMAFLKQHAMTPGSVTVIPRANKNRLIFPGVTGAEKPGCYTLQGRFVGPLSAVASSSHGIILPKGNGSGLLFTPDRGVMFLIR